MIIERRGQKSSRSAERPSCHWLRGASRNVDVRLFDHTGHNRLEAPTIPPRTRLGGSRPCKRSAAAFASVGLLGVRSAGHPVSRGHVAPSRARSRTCCILPGTENGEHGRYSGETRAWQICLELRQPRFPFQKLNHAGIGAC